MAPSYGATPRDDGSRSPPAPEQTPSAPKEKRRRRKRRADPEDLHPAMKRLNQLSDFIVTYIPWLFLGYLLFSAWFLHVHLQGEHDAFHTWIDTTYFVFITILTIGYGDVFPTTDAGKSYVIVFILVGACLGSVILGYVAEWVLATQERVLEAVARRRARMMSADVSKIRDRLRDPTRRSVGAAERGESAKTANDDVSRETSSPDADASADATNLPVMKALFTVLFFTTVGALSMMAIESLSFTDAFYWAVVTVTTVGYGDVAPRTDAGKLFVCFFATFAVGTVGWAISTIAEVYIKASLTNDANEKLERCRVTPEYLAEVGGKKGYVTRLDFFKATLVSLGKATNEDLATIDARFGELDVNDDGKLSIEDLIGDMDQLAADLAKVLRARDEVTDKRTGGG
jgi:potassium channel subfamily K